MIIDLAFTRIENRIAVKGTPYISLDVVEERI
jgi:hypothetical protein